MKADADIEPLARLIDALEPWLEEVVIIGGWAHRLYRLDTRAQRLVLGNRMSSCLPEKATNELGKSLGDRSF